MKKFVLLAIALLALLPFVSADMADPFYGLAGIFLFALSWILLANAGINTLVVFVFQRLFLNSFWEKLPAQKITSTIAVVTGIGLVADFIGAIVGSVLSLVLLFFLTGFGYDAVGNFYTFFGMLLFLVTFFCILILDFVFFKYNNANNKQALVLGLGLGIFTNPYLFILLLSLFLPASTQTAFLLILICAVLGPFILLALVHYLKSCSSGENKKELQKLWKTIGVLTLIFAVIGVIGFALSLGPQPQYYGAQPLSEAQTMIKSIAAHKATPVTSKTVTFTNNNSAINARSIADGSNGWVAEDQVCLSAGDFASDTANWIGSDTMASVRYQGSAKQATLEAVCDSSNTILAKGIKNYLAAVDPKLNIDGVNWENCSCLSDSNNPVQTCCLLAVKKTG